MRRYGATGDSWGLEIEGPIEEATKRQLDQWILGRMKEWHQQEYQDEMLFESYQLDFHGWTEAVWKRSTTDLHRYLREFLRAWGVCVLRPGTFIYLQLLAVLREKDFPIWPEDELDNQHELNRCFSRKLLLRTGQIDPPPPRTPMRIRQDQLPEDAFGTPPETRNQQQLPRQPANQQTEQHSRDHEEQMNVARDLRDELRHGVRHARTPDFVDAEDAAVLEADLKSKRAKLARDFYRFYQGNPQFSGNDYEFIHRYLTNFEDKLDLSAVPHEMWVQCLPSLLIGDAADFFYESIRDGKNPLTLRDYTYKEAINMIHNHFTTKERSQMYELRWNALTFEEIQREHPQKSKLEVLHALLAEIDKVVTGIQPLPFNAAASKLLKLNKIKLAMINVQEVETTIANPPSTWESMKSSLISSIALKERYQAVNHQFHAAQSDDESDGNTFSDYDDHQFDQNVVDRIYNRNNSRNIRRGRGRPWDKYPRRQYPDRPRNGSSQRNDSRGSSQSSRRGLRCFICGKEECWSTNHTDAERASAYQRYKNTSNREDTSRNGYNQFLYEMEGKAPAIGATKETLTSDIHSAEE